MGQSTSRAQRIADEIAQQIAEGRTPTGTRLPSVRAAARVHGVSKNTIVDAYDRLVATGYVVPQRGSGFYAAPLQARTPDTKPKHFTEAVDLVSLLREQLDRNYAVRAGDGRPPTGWMASPEISRYLKHGSAHREDADSFEYGRPQGFTPLREVIARALVERAINAYPDQVMLTFGANHAFDLIIRHFVEPGDAVVVETPGYYPLFGKLRLANARIAGVSRGPEGVDLDQLEQLARRHRPRLMFVQPLAHNPTGGSMSLANMHRLLRLAERHDLVLVENDPFGDILPRAAPRLAALDALQRVIYVGTVSKTLSAALRSGYIVAPQRFVTSLTDIKMLTVVNTSGTVERTLHDMITRGLYRRHLTRLRNLVARAGAEAASSLQAAGLPGVEPPTGGYYLWCPLPAHVDDMEVAREASARNIFLAPGALFSHADTPEPPALRINIAYATDPRLLGFLRDHVAAA